MTGREIKAPRAEIYGVAGAPDLLATVTDAVIEAVRAWRRRPLAAVAPLRSLNARQVTVKAQGRVSNKARNLAIGVTLHGSKEVLGRWAADNAGAQFWRSIITELKNRRGKDIFIAGVDGRKGVPEAIETTYPKTQGPALSRASDALFFG